MRTDSGFKASISDVSISPACTPKRCSSAENWPFTLSPSGRFHQLQCQAIKPRPRNSRAAACGSTCSDGQTAGTYVTVAAQVTYTPLLPYPTMGNSITLSAQTTARIQ